MLKRGSLPYPPSPRDNQHQNREFRDVKTIKDTLREIFGTILKLQSSELEEAETFQELGIGSFNVVQLLEVVNGKYNLNMPTSILFECRNIDALVEHINERLSKSHTVAAGLSRPQYANAEAVETRLVPSPEERSQQSRSKTYNPIISDDIAIVGLSLR